MNYTKSIAIASLLLFIGAGFIGYKKFKNQSTQLKEQTPSVEVTSIDVPTTNQNNISEASSIKNDFTQIQKNAKNSSTTNSEWKKILSADQYAVLREGATEKPYTSPLVSEKRKGSYVTADCGELVFRSEQKFDSNTGWPSFYAPASKGVVIERKDNELGTERTEIVSAKCSSHLGHVFNDAPQTPTGLRYCINGLAIFFIPD